MATPKIGGFFSAQNKRSEITEWRVNLNSDKEAVRKDAVKKVIAAMTVGKDVSMLFSDVVKCVQTNNIELKKLVYLYIMYYAKSQPDLAILAVNTFDSDAKHPNPLIRGLAVRTMACIRVPKILEYLAEPLRKSIRDKDPYVRKTAAVAIAKLFDMNSELAIEQGFVEALNELLIDDNPMVVANAVAALAEISSTSPEVNVEFNEKTVKTLLNALNECTEWGQVFILDSLVNYDPKSEAEANQIADRVCPRLAHSNSAVVLSATKVIMKAIGYMTENSPNVKNLLRKLAGPLVTLLNSEPEIQYVALRNIDLVVQKHNGILEKDVKVFFCKYNDPIYVKLEKLEIMIKLVTERNIDIVLSEFKEYATEVDVEFVRKSVRAIGRCAIKLEKAAQRCINALLELIETKVNYVVQEAIIVIKDIFRKYPNKYEGIIGTLCQNLDTLDEPDAKAAMIWIIGEYSDRIENATELISLFIETFHDEASQVQLQLLTATVKVFLKLPTDAKDIVQHVLTMSTEESDNPDLRDRGYIYWRLLSSNVQAAKSVILSEKPTITEDSTGLSKQLIEKLIPHIGTLASIYQKPPELFVPEYKKKQKSKPAIQEEQEKEDEEQYEREEVDLSHSAVPTEDDILGLGDYKPQQAQVAPSAKQPAQQAPPSILDMDDMFGTPAPVQSKPQIAEPIPKKNLLLPPAKGAGIVIYGAISKQRGNIVYDFTIENQSNANVSGLAAKFNVNTFGLVPSSAIQTPVLTPGAKVDSQVVLSISPNNVAPADKINNLLQVAIKANIEGWNQPKPPIFYFQDKFPISIVFEGSKMAEPVNAVWASLADAQSAQVSLANPNPEIIKQKLAFRNIFFAAQNQSLLYFSARFSFMNASQTAVAELSLSSGKLTVKCSNATFIPMIIEEMQQVLSE